jgi:hypothetical protein
LDVTTTSPHQCNEPVELCRLQPGERLDPLRIIT